MKAVILAAGLSSRIRAVANGMPKCLLPLGEQTILDVQIESLFAAGVEAIQIVTGYGKEHLLEHIAVRHPEKCDSICLTVNPKFKFTNNIYSLWIARQWVGQSDFLCLNADVLCHPRIIRRGMNSDGDISMIVDPTFREETMKVIIRGGHVVAMSKQIPRERASGTYIGITAFSRHICNPFFAEIQALLADGQVNVFFNAAVERLITTGTDVSFTTTEGLPWTEIDDVRDYQDALSNVYPRIAAHSVPEFERRLTPLTRSLLTEMVPQA